ncbi:uncharacterized protein N7477_002200 [Penicillium maclennaniae]|uniref:uncharacterized protein n=1 Tax=Penicillium maclennaniae TaxID=1343394 RepID=UPI002541C8B6|nr:uncharacterized protein N7477_002200 [Penicillium maclennaniae]KAJ5676567.1 hypothetical protein N7477_002200 [Penicillium maclennaniae]
MSPAKAVVTDKAPKPLPQFSSAVTYNGMIYCSGSLGLDPKTLALAEGGVKEQTRQSLRNLAAILEEAGSSLQNVVKANIFLTTMDNFKVMNEAWDEFFPADLDPKPVGSSPDLPFDNEEVEVLIVFQARTCVAAHQLPLGGDVEIECTAFLDSVAKL